MGSIMDWPGAFWGLISGVVVALLGLAGVLSKGRIDQNAKIMESWQAMNAQHLEQMASAREQFRLEVESMREAHKEEMKELRDDFADYKAAAQIEIRALRKRVTEVETEFSNYRIQSARDIMERDEIIAGMRRNMSQVGMSQGRINQRQAMTNEGQVTTNEDQVATNLEQAFTNEGTDEFKGESKEDRTGIHEELDRLNGMGDNSNPSPGDRPSDHRGAKSPSKKSGPRRARSGPAPSRSPKAPE